MKSLYQQVNTKEIRVEMVAKGDKENDLKKWLASERKRSEALDKMLLEQSRRHRALQKRTKIARFVVNR